MKKYKHKINGSIAEFVFTKSLTKDGFYSVKHKEGFTHIPIEFIENSNDWEEIKEEKKISNLNVKEEPNYLITAFKNNISGCIFKHDTQLKDMYCLIDGKKPFYDKADLLTNQSTVIYSVKNSKGEEFTIGELVKFSLIKLRITKFEISQFDEIHLFLENGNRYNLDLISKVKSPIYTTTDGVDIYEGQRAYIHPVSKDFKTIYPLNTIDYFSKRDKEVADRLYCFMTIEARDKYIKENSKKPIFVSADGVELFEEPEYVYSVLTKGLWPMERNYFYNHKYKSPEWKHFVTKEARQEYIDNNKPKYSLADIEKSLNGMIISYTPINKENIINRLKKLGK